MNPVFRQLQASFRLSFSVLNGAFSLCRSTPPAPCPVWGGAAAVFQRQFKGRPTEGFGRWRHLLPREKTVKKRKRKVVTEMKRFRKPTLSRYGTLNFRVTGYEMTLVEHYAQYIHRLCLRLNITVLDNYALPTKSTEVLLVNEQNKKMAVDSLIKTHERLIQLRNLKSMIFPVFLDVLLRNQPEGVQLSVEVNSVDHFHSRFKVRPDMDTLRAKLKKA